MSNDISHATFGPGLASEDITVRFPPGLGLIPPRDVPRIRRGRSVTDVGA